MAIGGLGVWALFFQERSDATEELEAELPAPA
jgi:hypothetical protein